MDIKGLTDKEVKESRAKFGSNEIPDSEPTTFWQEFKETFQDPMIKILLAIAVLMIVMFFFGYAEIYEPMGDDHCGVDRCFCYGEDRGCE